jgi:hypothetical protein
MLHFFVIRDEQIRLSYRCPVVLLYEATFRGFLPLENMQTGFARP